MAISILSTWAQIAASVAVLITLVYLTIQIRQNVSAFHSSSRLSLLENDREEFQHWLHSDDLLRKLARDEPLSFRDQFRFSCLWIMNFRAREYEYFQYRAGVLDEAAYRSYQMIIPMMLGKERYQRWWRKVGRNGFDAEFVSMVDDLMQRAPKSSFITDMGSWEEEEFAALD
jgi:hypothetical protein